MGKRKNKVYSAEFKISIIMDMQKHHMGYKETICKYWEDSKGKEPNYIKQLQRWERIYLEEAAEGLMKERRGRSCSAGGTRKESPPKLDKKLKKI